MKPVDSIPLWMRSLREYREELSGQRLAGISSTLKSIGEEIAENARVPPSTISDATTLSTLDNLGLLVAKREMERSLLEERRIEAEMERELASARYTTARKERMILDRLILRRQGEARASCTTGEDAP